MARLKFEITKETTLDEYLTNNYFSKKDIHLLKMEKRITINEKIISTNVPLQQNDVLEIDIIKDEPINIKPVYENLDIVFEDEIVLVINKPAGLLVHSDGTDEITLDNLVAGYYQQTGQLHQVYHIHRLDKETTGCIMYCKQSYLVAYFDHLLTEKKIARTYQAIVQGKIASDLTIDKPISRNRHINNKYIISSTGKKAITHVFVKKYINSYTLVECLLETGRTHQIRVHLASINHPIVGDAIYGNSFCKTMYLHSYKLRFFHPFQKKEIEVTCPNEAFDNFKG